VVSTDRTEGRIRRMLALGAQGYITKPFSPEALREELERLLGVTRGTE
jgi:two-component system chemotaxis response regulator CheY